MKLITLFLVASVLCGLTLASLNIPIIGWSSQNAFIKSEIFDTYSSEQFREMLSNLVSGQSSDIVNSIKPELITIFVEQQLRTDELSSLFDSYSNQPASKVASLKSNIEAARTSIFIPYVSTSGSFLSSVLSTISIDGTIYVATESNSDFHVNGASYIRLNQIKATASSSISNNKVDILVVVLPEDNQNQYFEQINSVEGNSVNFFTAENPTPLGFTMKFEQEKQAVYDAAVLADSNSTTNGTNSTSDYINYFPGPVLEAYLIVFILLVILFAGICCIADLQVPDKYEAPKQKVL
ncbi:hypothetical protein SAMD00019534_103530 [Acytostelium subglobosum LB1]|uniref:hypothetical protein n=1 Tax=Acytostelium subglobosum LB1 TaxID=1410327 RepID=UPI0006451620|nr:hypothetical protein SAMD00019534_103530 [Acytostelium subglobosum LB1]GAM27178.1 hypothetical protein SAMD00019534_103530 [Acytostelium subglobosum LB1]|eukprot:XP_012750058.1 hypothetical protein SAMD00019534_103530 [Acytostelium subglobosum LB1]